jgi:hypothetical protein
MGGSRPPRLLGATSLLGALPCPVARFLHFHGGQEEALPGSGTCTNERPSSRELPGGIRMPVRRIEGRERVRFRNDARRLARQTDALAQALVTAEGFPFAREPARGKVGVG